MRTNTTKLLWLAAINVFVIAANDDQPFNNHEGAAHLIDAGKDGSIYGAFAQHAIGKFEKPEVQDIYDLWENWYKEYQFKTEDFTLSPGKGGTDQMTDDLGISPERAVQLAKDIRYEMERWAETDPNKDGQVANGQIMVLASKYARSHAELVFIGYKVQAIMLEVKQLQDKIQADPELEAMLRLLKADTRHA